MWGYDDHDLMHIAEVRGGIRGADSLPDLGADGGRLNRNAKPRGRDAYLARLEHMMDDGSQMEPPGCPSGVPLEESEEDKDEEDKEGEEGEKVADTLRGRDLWIKRLCEERL